MPVVVDAGIVQNRVQSMLSYVKPDEYPMFPTCDSHLQKAQDINETRGTTFGVDTSFLDPT